MFVQMRLFNNTEHTKSVSFYIKWRQVKTEVGVSGREGKRGADKGTERQSIGENQKQRGLRNDHLKRHLSNSNQKNK